MDKLLKVLAVFGVVFIALFIYGFVTYEEPVVTDAQKQTSVTTPAQAEPKPQALQPQQQPEQTYSADELEKQYLRQIFIDSCAEESSVTACTCMFEMFSNRYPDFLTNMERMDRFGREELTIEEYEMILQCAMQDV